MSAIRLILLLVVLGCLTLFLLQNSSPALPLVFLGTQTQPLPLAIWILLGVVAGAITSLFISGCFKLSNYFAPPRPRKRRQVVETVPPRSGASKRSEASYTAASNPYTAASTTPPQPKTDSTPNNDDWESNASDDWNFEADEQDTAKTPKSNTQDTARDYTNYEANTEPKSSSHSGSVYSYGYREPSNSGVGRTESIYDADYRVLTPPYRQTDSSTSKDDDDWGFEDDEDWLDEDENDSPRPQK